MATLGDVIKRRPELQPKKMMLEEKLGAE